MDGERRKDPKRPPVRRRMLLHAMKAAILQGQLSPGERLPTHVQLCRKFKVSHDTVQATLSVLQQEGFVKSRGCLGSFVTDPPPHLHQVALVLNCSPESSLLLRSLFTVAQQISDKDPHFRILCYTRMPSYLENRRYWDLLSDLQSSRLLGLAFVFLPVELDGTPALTDPDLPRVAFGAATAPQIPAVEMRSRSFLRKACQWLRSRGRRRVALLGCFLREEDRRECFRFLRQRFQTSSCWVQACAPEYAFAARQQAALLFADKQHRPDAVLIADDHLVEAATAGLAEVGVRAGRDAEIVAHCNYPVLPKAHLPVTWLGIDCRELMRQSIARLVAQRLRLAPPSFRPLQALFEHEPLPTVDLTAYSRLLT